MSFNLFPSFEVSADLKARMHAGENRATTDVQLSLHGDAPPITEATNDFTATPPRYPLVVGDDVAAFYLPFEETSGTDAQDAVILANHGTYAASVVHIAGEITNPPPETSNAITTTVTDSVTAGSPIAPGGTLELWVRTTESPAAATYIASLEDLPLTKCIKLTLNTDGTLLAGVYNGTYVLQYSDTHPTAANNGAWRHVVIVDSGTTLLLYLDGALT